MLRTITIAGTISAQGLLVREYPDGRVTISVGAQVGALDVTGWPVPRVIRGTAESHALGH